MQTVKRDNESGNKIDAKGYHKTIDLINFRVFYKTCPRATYIRSWKHLWTEKHDTEKWLLKLKYYEEDGCKEKVRVFGTLRPFDPKQSMTKHFVVAHAYA